MAHFESIVDLENFRDLLGNGDVVVVDCRFYLDDENAGWSMYEAGHIPTARFADLNRDLSDLSRSGMGRHPLPTVTDMVSLFGRLGISKDKQVVAYDDTNGIAAARLWWMLRYLGHDHVAVLDGGFPAWKAAGLSLVAGIEEGEAVEFHGQARKEMLVEMEAVGEEKMLVDSRAPERYRGVVEPIDPVAGHIPGAVNYFHKLNHAVDGRFLAPSQLREQFEQLLGEIAAEDATFYCGSGVTACNNLLALAYAGMDGGRLYNGSWSQWCGVADNPMETSG